MSKIVFSGIQPTGELHLGNYFGAIKNWLKLQEKNQCYFCIVDLHAITIDCEPKKLQEKIIDTVAIYLALGIDPHKSTIFIQSHVPAHSELCWLLNTITPLSELERMTQYKEKRGEHQSNINAGLFGYPVLMAADILLYQTNLVPVGQDQKQHVELARTIARKFNQKFGETFTIPEHLIPKIGAKIMSLKDPNKKMSKSQGPQSYVSLSDSSDMIEKKIMSAVTDSGQEIIFDPEKKKAISNLMALYYLTTGESLENIQNKYKKIQGYAEFKKDLAQEIIKFLKPFQLKKQEILKDKNKIKKILADGAQKAQIKAEKTLLEVKDKMGLK